jgi:hypothetical protein
MQALQATKLGKLEHAAKQRLVQRARMLRMHYCAAACLAHINDLEWPQFRRSIRMLILIATECTHA